MRRLLLFAVAVMGVVVINLRDEGEKPRDPRWIEGHCPKCGCQTVLDLGNTNGIHEFHCETCTVDFQIFEE